MHTGNSIYVLQYYLYFELKSKNSLDIPALEMTSTLVF